MYESVDFNGGGSLFSQPENTSPKIAVEAEVEAEIPADISASDSSVSSLKDGVTEELPPEEAKLPVSETTLPQSSKKVVKVILLYGDNSFDSYNPGD
jgi:hypothetical protein